LAIVHATNHFLESTLVATLKTNGDFEILFFGFGGSGKDAANAWRVDGDWFFEKGVFPEAHSFLKVGGPECAGGGEDDDIG
jgi:hypothetical protein